MCSQAGLAHLYLSLDEPSFRDIWRAVAVPINRFLFNHIATEVQFTQAGKHGAGEGAGACVLCPSDMHTLDSVVT